PGDAHVHLGLAAQHTAHGVAHIRAVEVAPDAADQVSHVRLAETRVGARCAAGRAVDALLDAAEQLLLVQGDRPWVPLDDLSHRHVVLLLASGSRVPQNKLVPWRAHLARDFPNLSW